MFYADRDLEEERKEAVAAIRRDEAIKAHLLRAGSARARLYEGDRCLTLRDAEKQKWDRIDSKPGTPAVVFSVPLRRIAAREIVADTQVRVRGSRTADWRARRQF